MLGIAVFLTAILAVAGEDLDSTDVVDTVHALDPSSLVGQLNVSLFEKLLLRTLPQAMIPLHHNCTDYSETGDCGLVVENKLCSTTLFYARYCCRSCTLAKQIPTYGPHLRLTAKIPVTARITTDTREFRYGENVTVTCEVSGSPVPEALWFVDDKYFDASGQPNATVEDLGGILRKTRRETITIPATMFTNNSLCICVAMNTEGRYESHLDISIKKDIGISFEILPGGRLFTLTDNITLECTAQGVSLKDIGWKMNEEILQSSDSYNITEERIVEDGETRIHSNITFLRPKVMDGYVLCFATTLAGDFKTTSTRIIVNDRGIQPSCKDIADRQECFDGRFNCDRDYVQNYCCRTCTLMGAMPVEPHLPSSAEAPLDVYLWLYSRDVLYGENIIMTCDTTGYPGTQKVVWYKGNTMIEESDHHSIEETVFKSPMSCDVSSSLIIRGLTKRDFGKYTCKAVNDITESESSAVLQITRDNKFVLYQYDD
ncbi:neural cell adhesion molecule 1-like [Penaeus chinensis]|uniref:neural cell adhesion molecule 1-like n=1 Tax=Penaeus chinensis TaxID=139456 RepID=UPI001FB5B7AF|nr:neural cell adhesion molecule 1-like [Penaeus chinensis]